MKKCILLLSITITLFTSCLTLKPTGNIHEITIVDNPSEIIEEGKIYYSSWDDDKSIKIPDIQNEAYLLLKGRIMLEGGTSKTIIGNYKSQAKLFGIIESSENSSNISTKIEIDAEVYSDKIFNNTLVFPCSISDSFVSIENAEKIKADLNYANYYQNDLFKPVLLISDEYSVYKCCCAEYTKSNNSYYYSPDMNDIYAEYQKFQLIKENQTNEKTLLAEWNADSYKIFMDDSISSAQIKELIGISILRIEWSKLFAELNSKQQNELNLF